MSSRVTLHPPAGSLVSTEWLAGALGDPQLAVVDASWYLPSAGRDAHGEYVTGHVPGARWFDVDLLSDQASPLPHMLPDPDAFGQTIGTLGIGSDDFIVAYDGSGTNLSAARAWWMFRVFGHDRVAVLDGGLGQWKAEGRPLESGVPMVAPRRFTAVLHPDLLVSRDEIFNDLGTGRNQVLDARSPGRFAGTEPEPRPGIRGGHIPGSHSVPYPELVGPDGRLLPEGALRQRLAAAGVDPARPSIALCGSGVTACAILLALHQLGNRDARLYDGSWTEWGGRADLPVETGPGRATD